LDKSTSFFISAEILLKIWFKTFFFFTFYLFC